MNAAKWLEDWYASNCDGDWGYSYKNTMIGTLGNTGWSLQVNIRDMLEIERTKKRLGLLLVVAMVFLVLFLSGCQRNSDEENSNSTAPRITAVNTYHETIPVPENGWTAEDINNVIYVNGNKISFPCKIADFGEGFEWDTEGFSSFENETFSAVSMNYHGGFFAQVYVYASNEDELNEGDITGLAYFNCEKGDIIYLNGITKGNSSEQVIEKFGEPAYISNPEDKTLFIGYRIDYFFIKFSGSNDIVDSITIIKEKK